VKVMVGRQVSIILPALNEEETIGRVIDAVSVDMEGKGYRFEIVVVDDDSTDRTMEAAEEEVD